MSSCWKHERRCSTIVVFAVVVLAGGVEAGESAAIRTDALPVAKDADGRTRRSRSLFPVKKLGRWGYIDAEAKIRIPPRFDRADEFAEGLASVTIGSHMGYIDRSGAIAIKPQFVAASPFSNGRARVVGSGLPYFIDGMGKRCFDGRWFGVQDFRNGYAIVQTALVDPVRVQNSAVA